ncbi:MAG: hypothetical protein OXN17_06080 [Candidatus Poribacteria bacterium]|nr:hypothetical protein [Candidatus Poribacteria bacterium]MDE0504185.1 hypothetical protein [Candidatus Poribacteria bacterium]
MSNGDEYAYALVSRKPMAYTVWVKMSAEVHEASTKRIVAWEPLRVRKEQGYAMRTLGTRALFKSADIRKMIIRIENGYSSSWAYNTGNGELTFQF